MINDDFPIYDELLSSVDKALVSRYSPERLCSSLKSILENANVEDKRYIALSLELIILHHARLSSVTEVPAYSGIQKDKSLERDIDKLPVDLQHILFVYAERCCSL